MGLLVHDFTHAPCEEEENRTQEDPVDEAANWKVGN